MLSLLAFGRTRLRKCASSVHLRKHFQRPDAAWHEVDHSLVRRLAPSLRSLLRSPLLRFFLDSSDLCLLQIVLNLEPICARPDPPPCTSEDCTAFHSFPASPESLEVALVFPCKPFVLLPHRRSRGLTSIASSAHSSQYTAGKPSARLDPGLPPRRAPRPPPWFKYLLRARRFQPFHFGLVLYNGRYKLACSLWIGPTLTDPLSGRQLSACMQSGWSIYGGAGSIEHCRAACMEA
jgi:hypothetical protein